MTQRRITVTIDKRGNPKIEVDGVQGADCTRLTAPIEQALAGGAGQVETVLKPEFHAYADDVVSDEVKVTW